MATVSEYEAGLRRGRSTGRTKPNERDLFWIEVWTGRSDLDLSEIARGMRDGAAL